MSQLDELDEQKQKEWQSLVAQQRLELSDSVQESLAHTSLQEDNGFDETEGSGIPVPSSLPNGQAEMIIPPRLSLHSKPMPVVHPQVAAHEPSSPQFAGDSTPTEPRVTGRLLKVRLEAVLPSEESHQQLEVAKSLEKATTRPLKAVQTHGGSAAKLQREPSRTLSGIFDRGQMVMTIMHPRITQSSVIVVMLTGNPGHVVVHYVSLHPQVGFTVHLSAPAERATPFNYLILAE